MQLSNFSPRRTGIYFLLLVLLVSCSGISLLGSKKNYYSDPFLSQINIIKSTYRKGNVDVALQKLKMMDEQTMLPTEKALRRNLIGVIYFAKKNFEQAIFNFDLALTTSRLDESLTSQIRLNLASSYFKLGFMEKAYNILVLAESESMKRGELKKYYKLRYKLAKELGKDRDVIISLIKYLSTKNKLAELKNENFFELMIGNFFKLDKREKFQILEELEDGGPLAVGYLGYLEAEKLYYKGEKEEAKDLLEWLDKKFSQHEEITMLVKNFFFRVESFSKLDSTAVGILLPLSGPKKNFGKRALLGIDAALKKFNKDTGKNLTLFVKDSEGSGSVGTYRIKELIEHHFVSAIIGGLYSSEATKEYLEAKKHGVFFISLSQVFLPKEKKDHLLLEIPGSVESQVDHLFTPQMTAHFGKRAAIIYPSDRRGEAYVNEFWRKAKLSGISVTSIHSYKKGQTDYRGPVSNILGLKFKRERQEEFDILSEVYALEKKRSARRIQVLGPKVDFDWIFMPAYPKEAIQIIPSFSYFDAYKLKIIGGPSWRSKSLSNESRKFGKLFFVGDDVSHLSPDFLSSFQATYNKKPRILEMMGYDAFNITSSLVTGGDFSTRDELDIHVRAKAKIEGLTGEWALNDGVWMKNLSTLRLSRGKVDNYFESIIK